MPPDHPTSKCRQITGIALALATAFPGPAMAGDLPLAAAFDRAAEGRGGIESTITFHASGCDFGETVVNLDFCRRRSQGEGDRVIRTNVFLGEVARISAKPFNGRHGEEFMLTFDLEYEQPGQHLTMIDRILSGGAAAFDRLGKREAAALEQAEFRSAKTYSECGGAAQPAGKARSMTFFVNHEPEGWRRLIETARACRGDRPLAVEDGYAARD